jgi:putative flippase GtrA
LDFKAQFFRFFLVGVAATLSTYATLILLVEIWQVNAIVASVVGYIVGIAVNYKLNYRFTFRSSHHHRFLLPKFLVVMIAGLLLNIVIMFIGISWIGIHYALAQLAAVAIVLVWSFAANRLWVFAD